VTEALGRGYYERSGGSSPGHRNGWREGLVKTAEGELAYAVPQVRGLLAPFRSKVRLELRRRSEALEDFAVEMYARGLSTRDIEATFCDEEGAPYCRGRP
jgi:transposase-like protein